MGRIVSAAATSHTLGPPNGIEARADRVFEGMLEVGRRIRTSRPDVVLIVTSDHLQNFHLDRQIPFAVGLSDTFTPLGDLGVPQTRFPGHRDFAAGLVAYAAEHGYDLVGAESVRPDHGFGLPNAVINTNVRIPVVPVYVNSVMTPPPSCRRSFGLGRVIRDYIATARSSGERVAIVGAGGLSHWICTPGEGQVNAAWDRWIIGRFVGGRAEEVAELTTEAVVAEGGNGGLEITAWLCMAGAVAGATGEEIYYEAMPEWWTGMGGIVMHVS